MKAAYFTPVNPQKTGISDYSEIEVIPHLSRYIDLDIFIDSGVSPENQSLKDNFRVLSCRKYKDLANQYDVPIYNMGNNSIHEFIYNSIITFPGIVILHDIYLHGFFWSCSISKGDTNRYIEEFKYCYGKGGLDYATRAIDTGAYNEFKYPLLKRISDRSIGIVCHSDYGVKKVLGECDTAIVKKINQPFTIPEIPGGSRDFDINEIKTDFGVQEKGPIISSFGYISSHKRYPVILKSFKKFLRDFPNALLLLVGQDLMGIDGLISDLKLTGSVIKTGYVPQKEISDILAISDFSINLRYPTAGETSRSVLHLMAAEKPVIVSNVGWFSEIPDNCCLKVNVDSYEVEIIYEYMKALASDESLRKILGRNGKDYVKNKHDPEKVAKEIHLYISQTLDGSEIILNSLSKELAELDLRETDSEIFKHLSKRAIGII